MIARAYDRCERRYEARRLCFGVVEAARWARVCSSRTLAASPTSCAWRIGFAHLPERGFGRTGPDMHSDIASKRTQLAALARQHGVTRLEVFGSAARADDFDRSRSDADFLVTFAPASRDDFVAFADFKEALERLLGRPVDLVEREAVEASRNFIRRRRILAEAEEVYG